MARPKLSGLGTLAAASVLARCVLTHGCPVVSVHGSFGFARHIGQRTDRICRSVSCSVFTTTIIRQDAFDRWSIVLGWWFSASKNRLNRESIALRSQGDRVSRLVTNIHPGVREVVFRTGLFLQKWRSTSLTENGASLRSGDGLVCD